ncbi:MAG: DUF3108 domain-containing protein [Rhodothermaceae bacterium]
MKLVKIIFVLTAFTMLLNAQKKDFRKIEHNAFDVGEKLTFEVNYGPITAGIAVMEIPKLKRISGRDSYNIQFKVNSVSSFDGVFKVRDKYVTYLDKEGIFPWRFEQHIREGGYSKDYSAFFDQRRGKAKTSNGKVDIPPYVNDIVSAFYYLRTQNLSKYKKGDKIEMENFFDNKIFPLNVMIHGREEVDVEAGTFKCVVVEPLVKEGGLFKHEGNILIWLTDDHRRMPVKVKTKIIIGSIEAELIKHEGLTQK